MMKSDAHSCIIVKRDSYNTIHNPIATVLWEINRRAELGIRGGNFKLLDF